MLNSKKVGFIGSGNMGEALIRGLITSGSAAPENMICSDVRENRLEFLKKKFGIRTTTNNTEVVSVSDIIVYAVKPQLMVEVLKETADGLDMSKLIISIAAGVPLAAIESCLDKPLRLIRVMPNVAVSVGEGAAAVASGKNATKEDIQLAMEIFNAVGKSIFLKENYLLDAVTGLSGSGPAYIFLIVDALADAGVKMGLSRDEALLLSSQTVLGAAKMLLETNTHPGQLKDMVTSPGGTAIAGLHTLEKGGLRTTLINAVEAATNRSMELGEMMIKHFTENHVGRVK
ncbi:MAG: pyrroline-5-carboxylate reductase [Deltaproteobacteria bacterium]|nr:pyrroline-5-carboxylate reductase [Deltaproteobacteria bacterium]